MKEHNVSWVFRHEYNYSAILLGKPKINKLHAPLLNNSKITNQMLTLFFPRKSNYWLNMDFPLTSVIYVIFYAT